MNITFVGDIFPSDEPFSLGFGIKSQFEKRWGDNWRHSILSMTKDSDVVIGNLESPLLDSSLAEKADFYGNPKFACFLKECGIGVLNVANNHILEHGKRGYEETLKALADSKIKAIGDNNRVLYLNSDECKIAIVGFSGVDLDASDKNGCYSVLNEQNVISALNGMIANNADLKIFCFHWGNEYIHKPSMEQRMLACKLIDAGADLIIGHHPHVIQPYEQYKKGHIFYSLGNFCFDNPFQSRQFSKGMGVTINYNIEAKGIEQVYTFGLRLSLKGLVYKMPFSQFKPYLDKIQKDYEVIKNTRNYHIRYEKELAKRHITERILMKVSLLRLFFTVNKEEKRMLLKNVGQFYLK